MATNWEGLPVPPDEQPEDKINVWEVEPHIDTGWDVAIIRSWQEMLDFVQRVAESECEWKTEEELRWDGVTISIRLREMTKAEYDETMATDD